MMDEAQASLLKRGVRRVLLEWDPLHIGQDADWPKDEYDIYIEPLAELLLQKADVEALTKKLDEIMSQSMGMPAWTRRNRQFAAKLHELLKELDVQT